MSYLNKINRKKVMFMASMLLFALCMSMGSVYARDPNITLEINSATGNGSMGALDIMYLFVILTLLPSLVLLCTSFTRIIIVFSLARGAMGTQQSPPNMVMTGLAVFLTLFIMTPTLNQVIDVAYEPYKAGEVTAEEAIKLAEVPIKEFMLKQVDKDSLNLFLQISGNDLVIEEGTTFNEALMQLDFKIVAPAFATSELKRGFLMGFLVYIPFVIIDLVVSSTLMAMGMVMLPPGTISMPFKLLVFILADGWGLMMSTLIKSFRL